jgi:hypothetical protein
MSGERKMSDTSVRVADTPAELRSKYLLDISPEKSQPTSSF